MSQNPQAHICVRKSRLRADGNTVYLAPNTEFEIELFNPTQDTIAAEIEINGRNSGDALVLRPGQRVFVERYLNEAEKYKFETYEVENTSEVRSAIRNNGDITVKFRRERKPDRDRYFDYIKKVSRKPEEHHHHHYYPYKAWPQPWEMPYWSTTNSPTLINTGATSSNITLDSFNLSNTVVGRSANLNSTYTSNSNYGGTSGSISFNSKTGEMKSFAKGMDFMEHDLDPTRATNIGGLIETGRVEKGGNSAQAFTDTYIDLESWAFHTVNIKLLPLSQKPEEIAALYCAACGRRSREKENFCPKCGTKHSRT